MRLKDLISYLEFKDENAIAVNGFGAPHSYRGWYEQIAFEPVEQTTAGDMLVCAREALGKTFTGWKGGDFYMDGNSFVNIAFQNDCGQDDEITVERLDAMFEKPPQRTWVGLTWDDISNEDAGNLDFYRGAKWAETKLRSKNENRMGDSTKLDDTARTQTQEGTTSIRTGAAGTDEVPHRVHDGTGHA